jgi:hypothetical protein
VKEGGFEGVARLTNSLFHQRNRHWESWKNLVEADGEFGELNNGTRIHYVAILGLNSTVSYLLACQGLDVNMVDNYYYYY